LNIDKSTGEGLGNRKGVVGNRVVRNRVVGSRVVGNPILVDALFNKSGAL